MELLSAQLQTIADAVKAGLLWARGRLALIALIFLGVSVPLWLLEHDARLRRDLALRQLREQTAAQIADLRARATAALRDAEASARRVQDLEAQRRQLEGVALNLKSQVSDLQSRERSQLQEVAALPFPELTQRLVKQLGADGIAISEKRNPKIENRQSLAVSPQLPAAGDNTQGTAVAHNPKSQIQNPNFPSPESPIPHPGLFLSEGGARAIASALIERDACREQSHVQARLLANCQEQAAASRAVIEEMSRSFAGLKEAVRLKDEIQSRTDAAHRAELKAARGSRLRRFGRALQYVGAGVVIGVVVAQ